MGDPARPFVDVSATSRGLTRPDDISAVAAVAVARYGRLSPQYLRWWTSQPAGAVPAAVQDKRFLAAPIRDLIDHPVPESLTLRPAGDLSHYDEAVAAYRSVERAHPDHARQAAVEPADDLEGPLQAGTLFDVLVDRRWAGYVAVNHGHKLGLAGYMVAELILTDTARGHGFGPHLTTLLACTLTRLTAEPNAVLIGTIHHDNTGALRAARQAGRLDIGGWMTCPLAIQ